MTEVTARLLYDIRVVKHERSQPSRLRACEKIVASEETLRSAGAEDRFAGSETAHKPRRDDSQG
jgi:hypothetical protein